MTGPAPAPIALEFTVTLDDQLRFTEWLLDRPARRRRRLAVAVATTVLSPLFGIVIAELLISLEGGTSFLAGLADLATDPDGVRLLAIVIALMAVGFAVVRALRRPRLRRRLRKLLAERPGVDPADPDLQESARVVFGPDGFTSETAASTVRVAPAGLKGLADAGSVWGIMTGSYTGFVVPKRSLSSEQASRLAAMLPPYVGGIA